jgi:hypothetical protein
MTRVVWDTPKERVYEYGIDRGILYVPGHEGVPWNGLTSVAEKPSGGDSTPYHIDGVKYLNVSSSEEFAATITAFTYPPEFEICDGSAQIYTGLFALQQPRVPFNFSYRTLVGNSETPDLAYKIHFVYNAMVTPSERNNQTVSEDLDPMDFSWDISVLPISTPGFRETSHFILDTRIAHTGAVLAIEDILYGDADHDPRMPTISEMVDTIELYADLRVIDNGDGTFTVIGPDAAVLMLDAYRFQIAWPSVVILDANRFSVTSL